ncbi:hypothetical protein HDU98_011208, partial [Podochytrium sp. JEL0797]
MNDFASSFMSNLKPFGAQAAKGLSQGLQYAKEATGQVADVTELPAAYKDLEAQVDAIKSLHEHFLKISVNYTRKNYDYQPPLTDTAMNYASSMKSGFSSLLGNSAAGAAPVNAAEEIPPSLPHALAKAASVGREGLSPQEPL